jgi:hypothetical protein
MKGFAVLNMQVKELSKQLASWQKYTVRAHTDE